jgi:hypothetical protein
VDGFAKRTQTRPVSRVKGLLFWLVLIVVVCIAAEFCSYAAFFIIHRKPFSFARTQAERSARIPRAAGSGEALLPRHLQTEVLHPYVGYVKNPELVESANEYGFVDSGDFVCRRSEGKVIVGIAGGSVAFNFADLGVSALKRELREASHFKDKEIQIVNMALGGYRQPQQLMALNYLLALGGELDYLINIDGFNEVVLYAAEGAAKGVCLLYPREWYLRVESTPDPIVLQTAGNIINHRVRQAEWARFFSKPVLRHSVSANLIWKVHDFWRRGSIEGGYAFLRTYTPDQSRYVITGPSPSYRTEEEMYARLAALWKRCSVQMDRLCGANGIRYFHFLQPNQYVAGSKEIGPQERRRAYDPDHPYKPGVERGYPHLIREGLELGEMSIGYHDLTMIFRPHDEPIYVDSCCHFNQRGYDIMAGEIARRILATPNGSSPRELPLR